MASMGKDGCRNPIVKATLPHATGMLLIPNTRGISPRSIPPTLSVTEITTVAFTARPKTVLVVLIFPTARHGRSSTGCFQAGSGIGSLEKLAGESPQGRPSVVSNRTASGD